ncbi:MAG: hypothetical protein R3D00_17660 [Bacteroidia bacterium]
MKKYSFGFTTAWLMVLLSLPFQLHSQECIANDSTIVQACCNGLIRTDSAAALNNARPNLRNRFEWRNPIWEVYIPTPGGGYTYNGTQPPL